jgi:hypothetical protein
MPSVIHFEYSPRARRAWPLLILKVISTAVACEVPLKQALVSVSFLFNICTSHLSPG